MVRFNEADNFLFILRISTALFNGIYENIVVKSEVLLIFDSRFTLKVDDI